MIMQSEQRSRQSAHVRGLNSGYGGHEKRTIEEGLGGRRAAGNVNVDGDNTIAATDDRIRLTKEGRNVSCAVVSI